MASLVDKIKSIDKRVEGLENKNISNQQILALIEKIYGEVEVSVKVSVSKHQNWVAGTYVRNFNGNMRV